MKASPIPDIEAPVIKEEANLFDLEIQPREEPRGLDLATDMTSSFIDPSTMGPDSDEILQPEVLYYLLFN